jgi:hypothetical protein
MNRRKLVVPRSLSLGQPLTVRLYGSLPSGLKPPVCLFTAAGRKRQVNTSLTGSVVGSAPKGTRFEVLENSGAIGGHPLPRDVRPIWAGRSCTNRETHTGFGRLSLLQVSLCSLGAQREKKPRASKCLTSTRDSTADSNHPAIHDGVLPACTSGMKCHADSTSPRELRPALRPAGPALPAHAICSPSVGNICGSL